MAEELDVWSLLGKAFYFSQKTPTKEIPIMTSKVRLASIFFLSFLFFPLIAQWERNNGPEGGFIHNVFSDGQTIYGGTYGGVYLSNDDGLTWIPANHGMSLKIKSITKSEGSLFVATDVGVFGSKDEGQNWNLIENGLPTSSAIEVFSHEEMVFASFYPEGIFRSIDGGLSWNPVNMNTPEVVLFKYFVANDQLIFAIEKPRDLYYSTDKGESWSKLIELPDSYAKGLIFKGDQLYALSDNDFYLLNTFDTTLTKLSSGLPSNGGLLSVGEVENIFYVQTYYGLYLSQDSGNSWEKNQFDFPNFPTNTRLSVHKNALLFPTFYGLYHSSNEGQTWSISPNDFKSSRINSMLASEETIFTNVSQGGNHISTDLGNTWQSDVVQSEIFHFLNIIDDKIYASGSNQVWHSSDMGTSWEVFSHDLCTNASCIEKIDGKFYVGGEGVFISEDEGNTWVQSTEGLKYISFDLLLTAYITSIKKTEKGLIAGAPNLTFISYDEGISWETISGDFGAYELEFHEDVLYARSFRDLLRSKDGGESWEKFTTGLQDTFASDFLKYKDRLYIATSHGIYTPSKDQTEWIKVVGGLDYNRKIKFLEAQKGYFFAGTEGAGVWMSEIIDPFFNVPLTEDKITWHAYPNPFQSNIEVPYINNPTESNLCLLDGSGRKVECRKIIREYGSIHFDTKSLPKGIYFLQLSTETQSEVLKMVKQ